MIRLSEFLTRRRWLVLAAWIVVVALALPLASRQTENLMSGGFEVPGSQSQIVEDALSEDFDPAQSGGMNPGPDQPSLLKFLGGSTELVLPQAGDGDWTLPTRRARQR